MTKFRCYLLKKHCVLVAKHWFSLVSMDGKLCYLIISVLVSVLSSVEIFIWLFKGVQLVIVIFFCLISIKVSEIRERAGDRKGTDMAGNSKWERRALQAHWPRHFALMCGLYYCCADFSSHVVTEQNNTVWFLAKDYKTVMTTETGKNMNRWRIAEGWGGKKKC